ncbi:hypothetical protein [Streptomyces crystallinus]|uniref:Uncharacterized protein n=1 Tax=Streptomyces crystallinus TaxID=68191 RepID=A0ABP3QFX2_9ACTN
MQRKGGRGGAGQDVDTVLDQLYVTPPPEFVARREELAATAKTAGDTEAARRIRAARRPTLAAWAANLLRHTHPEESERFLELGQALREAYQALDADGIKELNEQRRSVVSALSGQAAELAEDAGHRLSDAARQDVETTLRAVLADQEAADAWATGHLASALTPPSTFPGPTDASRAPTRRTSATPPPKNPSKTPSKIPFETPPKPSPKTPPKSPPRDELADRRRKREREAERLAQAKRDEAERAADAAQRQLREKRAEHAESDERRRRARDRHDQVHREVSTLEQQLRRARDELERAEHEHRQAEEQHQAAARALTEAERAAREADAAARRPT